MKRFLVLFISGLFAIVMFGGCGPKVQNVQTVYETKRVPVFAPEETVQVLTTPKPPAKEYYLLLSKSDKTKELIKYINKLLSTVGEYKTNALKYLEWKEKEQAKKE